MEELFYFIIIIIATIAAIAILVGIKKCLCGSSGKTTLDGVTSKTPGSGFVVPTKTKHSKDYFGRKSSSSSSSSRSSFSVNGYPDATGPADDYATGPADDATGPADDATGADDCCCSVDISCSADCNDVSQD